MAAATIPFQLPSQYNATTPPERRGVRRDHVRMMVINRITGETEHKRFYDLEHILQPGDTIVLNSSRTVPAVLFAQLNRQGNNVCERIEVRLAHRKNEQTWEAIVLNEQYQKGDTLIFSPNLEADILSTSTTTPFVTLQFSKAGTHLFHHIYTLGEPIRYEYIEEPWSLDYYQTVFGNHPGSVEMPSAGRAFSWELIFKLKKMGIAVEYIQLHTGLSYLGDDKWNITPRENFEQFVVPEKTVQAINQTKQLQGRVIAVGTTVVRALESATDNNGILQPKQGWTNLYITKKYDLKVADALITGLHEPEASHLDLLTAFITPKKLQAAYEEAIANHYLWHEFGDMNLII